MNLSRNFTLEEATYSETATRRGIDNTPSEDVVKNMVIAAGGLEKVRKLLGNKPILISSWLRLPALNVAVGGSATSDHCFGWAIDFRCPKFGTPYEIAMELSKHKAELGYDQLIHEYGTWVHISFSPKKRMQDLSIFTSGKYIPGIQNK